MKVGQVIIPCPGCGTDLAVKVDLERVEESAYRTEILVTFRRTTVIHSCKGAP